MKWLRWMTIAIGSLVMVLAVVGLVLYVIGGSRLARRLSVDVPPIEVPTDSMSVAEGCRLAQVLGCADCHGERLEGAVLVDDPVLGRLVAPHIAPGKGSVTADYDEADWIRALRHGIGGDGRPLTVMPSSVYQDFSMADLVNIVACMKSADPVDHQPPPTQLRFARVLMGAGVFKFEYDLIDHSRAAPGKPASDDPLALGAYMVRTCQGCHGDNLQGSTDPQFGGPALAPGGVLDEWEEAEFVRFFGDGVTPDGRQIDPGRMPWFTLGFMTEDELHAVWAYLRSLPTVSS